MTPGLCPSACLGTGFRCLFGFLNTTSHKSSVDACCATDGCIEVSGCLSDLKQVYKQYTRVGETFSEGCHLTSYQRWLCWQGWPFLVSHWIQDGHTRSQDVCLPALLVGRSGMFVSSHLAYLNCHNIFSYYWPLCNLFKHSISEVVLGVETRLPHLLLNWTPCSELHILQPLSRFSSYMFINTPYFVIQMTRYDRTQL